ncbi:MAG TPA: hypothetical protein VNL77_09075 [Roseiflexaceae bacterium]|nr:hypothetical protein [Roseiflexaceae bacterium]
MMGNITTTWDATEGLLISRLTGKADVADVRRWEEGLMAALARIPDGTTFKLLSGLFGYEPADLDAHKAMRTVIPLLLTTHGFRTGLVDIVGAEEPTLTTTRRIMCVAVAHVHHDPDKMALYQERVGRANERFFTDYGAAHAWLSQVGR